MEGRGGGEAQVAADPQKNIEHRRPDVTANRRVMCYFDYICRYAIKNNDRFREQ
jgi:hypothetical protein